LAGLAGNKFLNKNTFQELFEIKTCTLFHQKILNLLQYTLHWATGLWKTICFQPFGIFIMMQRSCFKQIMCQN